MTRLVVWGGPLHDTVIAVPGPPLPVLLVDDDESDDVPGPMRSGARTREPLRYRLERIADRRPSQLARDRRHPAWWAVYVLESATRAQLDAWLRRSSRPMVAGPRTWDPHPATLRALAKLRDPSHDVVPIGADLDPDLRRVWESSLPTATVGGRASPEVESPG